MVLTPQGKVSGYLGGVRPESDEIEGRLAAARVGSTSGPVSDFILSCFLHEEPKGIGAVITKIMRYGALIFVMGMAIALVVFGIKRSREDNMNPHHLGSSQGHV